MKSPQASMTEQLEELRLSQQDEDGAAQEGLAFAYRANIAHRAMLAGETTVSTDGSGAPVDASLLFERLSARAGSLIGRGAPGERSPYIESPLFHHTHGSENSTW